VALKIESHLLTECIFIQQTLPNNGLLPGSLMIILGADRLMTRLLALKVERIAYEH
jgi:hypothetical protein